MGLPALHEAPLARVPLFYFAYGSNLDADQMRQRCPSARAVFRARLDHYRLDFTHPSRRWRGGAADVLPCVGDCVWGVVYELHEEDLERLDRYEGGYERVVLYVSDDAGREHPVLSYAVREKTRLPPTRAYLDKMLRWGGAWSFPDAYLGRLRRLEAVEPWEPPPREPQTPLPTAWGAGRESLGDEPDAGRVRAGSPSSTRSPRRPR